MKRFISYITVILLTVSGLMAQVPEPAAPQSGSILLTGGIAHLGNGEVIENSIITIEDGKIGVIANARLVRMDFSQFDERIDISGKHVYPGLILPSTTLGLEEISAVRATRDFREVGGINPNVRSLVAYNTDSELIATLRYNGILLAQVTPEGGTVSGSSSIMMLDGWNWEDAAYTIDDGVHVTWPRKRFGPRWWLGETEGRDNKNYAKSVASIAELIEDANSYHEISGAKEINIKLEALKGVLDGSQNLYLHAEKRSEMMESIQWAKKAGIKKMVLVGASEAYYLMDFIKENDIPVILGNVHDLPTRNGEDVNLPYKLPSILVDKGILVGLAYDGRLASSRNLPFYAGTAAAYGLDKEEALKLVTSNTAKILGIDETTGTIEGDKDANIIISTGDIFDMRTNNIEMAFIQGRKINLDGKQQVLHERFKRKYGGK